jgi:hypothetical protein
MTMAATMTAIGAALTGAGVARVYDWPTESVTVPCAIVAYPEIDFDFTMRSTTHLATYPVWLLVGRASTRAARAAVDPYLDSIPPALDGDLGGVVDSASCRSGRLAVTTIAGTQYLGLMFSVEVIE